MRIVMAGMVAVTCLWPACAAGQVFYLVKDGGWTVTAYTDRCVATNRLASEFGVAPYNGLWLTQRAGEDGVRLRVAFWPGAFEANQALTLDIEFRDGSKRSVAATATATTDWFVDLDEPLSSGTLAEIAAAGLFSVSPSNGAATLAFDTSAFAGLAFYLRDCARLLKSG